MGFVFNMKKVTGSLLVASVVSTSFVPYVTSTYAQALTVLGTPYSEEGVYDVTVPHIVINQLYGAGLKAATDSYFSHGFIELYNPTNEDIDLSNWSLQYADRGSSATSGATNAWEVFQLEGTIKAKQSYLIIGKATSAANKTLLMDLTDKADMSIDRYINNKGMKVALVYNNSPITIANPFETKPDGYVDLVGTGSNDDGSDIDGYETEYPSGDLEGTSKKKAILRKLAQDNDNNKSDFIQVDYSSISSELFDIVKPRGSSDGIWIPSYSPSANDGEDNEGNENEEDSNLGDVLVDKISINKIASYSVGTSNEDGGVSEIVKYNKDNGKLYLVNGSTNPPSLEIIPLTSDRELQKEISINVQELVEHDGFVYGDLTSVNVNVATKEVIVSVQAAGTNDVGKVVVLDYDGNLLKEYEVGVQPDMITRTEDGRYILSANEGEPREKGVDPKGSITIIDTVQDKIHTLFFDDESIIDDNVIIRGSSDENDQIVSMGSKADAITDLEPEYISLSSDGKYAYVSLQENNAIATLDIEGKKIVSVKGLGYKDFNEAKNALDVLKDNKILLENVPFKGMYMPDGIATFTVEGTTYIVTANEGDATAWDGRTNESKVSALKSLLDPESEAAKFLAANGNKYDKLEAASGMPNDSIYLYGARSFSIWNSETMTQVYDSGSEFERIVGQRLPDYFNASNSNATLDSRSQKKGPEPEDVKVGEIGSQQLAFVGLERIGGFAVYNVTDPANSYFVNYSNSRDFSNPVNTDSAPEGLEFISAKDSITGKPLLIVAYEVSGTVGVYEIDVPVFSVKKDSYSITQSQSLDLSKEFEGWNEAENVIWESSNPSIATINEEGIVQAKSVGSITISLTSEDGYAYASTEIDVKRNNSYVNNGSNNSSSNNGSATAITKTESADKSQVMMTGTAEQWLAQEGNQIQISTSQGIVTIDKAALAEQFKQLGITNDKEVQVTLTKTNSQTWKITVSTDTTTISLPVQLSIPYQVSQDASTAGLVVYHVQADGTLVEVKANYVNGQVNITDANGSYIITYVQSPFLDVMKPETSQVVQYFYARNWINGMTPTSFGNNEPVTRAQLLTIMYRMAGETDVARSNTFTDVPQNAYYADAIYWGIQNKFTNGLSNNSFGPGVEMTREQVAVFAYRYLSSLQSLGNIEPNATTYVDQDSISAYAVEAIQYLTNAGIIQGYSNSAGNISFAPKQAVTREEALLILYRVIQSVQ